jgi:hypothetical protein
MNAYTAYSQARIRQQDIATILRADVYLASPSLEALERQRVGQAESEVNRLLEQHGITRMSTASRVSGLRQTVGAAIIRAGKRLVGASRTGAGTEQPGTGTLSGTTARS